VFEEAKKTKPLRAIFYNKYEEMLRKKDTDLGVEKFKSILRFEINAKRKKNVRDLAETESNQILEILNSQANLYLKVFEKLFRGQISLLLKENVLESLKRGDIRKYYEVKGVISEGKSLEEYKSILLKGGYSESNVRKIIRDLIRVLEIEPSRNERMKELYELIKKIA
jgi:polyribonucleotide nucleotidyltransferase